MSQLHKGESQLNTWELLRNAIIMQACTDYRKYKKILEKNPKSAEAKKEIAGIKRFFRSQYFENLTDISGECFIKRLESECKSRKFYIKGE